jgi:hypothetical protein
VSTESVELVFAPPLLLTVTPGATSVVDDVVPDAPDDVDEVATEDLSSLLATDPLAEPSAVPTASLVAPSLAVPVSVTPAEESVPAADAPVDVDDESEDVSVVSAMATPGDVTTITPIPKAAAKAPTRPM